MIYEELIYICILFYYMELVAAIIKNTFDKMYYTHKMNLFITFLSPMIMLQRLQITILREAVKSVFEQRLGIT